MSEKPKDVSDKELKTVIADFLDIGHVENIVSMFRQDPQYYEWTGELLLDDRFNVRLGVSVLFEELHAIQPHMTKRAIPSLIEVLQSEEPLFRGEAVSVLGIIGGPEVINLIQPFAKDPSPQVREMVQLVLDDHA